MEDKVVAYKLEEPEVEFIFPVRDGQGWVSQAQMTELFKLGHTQILRYVQRVFAEEGLDKTKHTKKMCTLVIESRVGRTRESKRIVVYCSFLVAKCVGLRVKSKSAIRFIKWIDDVANEVQRINSKPLVETVDLRIPPIAHSAIDMVFKRWMHNSLKTEEFNRFQPSVNNSVYDAVSTRCLGLLKRVEEEE